MMKLMKRLILVLVLLSIAVPITAQTQQTYPRLRLSFNGSSTLPTADIGGWQIWRTSGVTPSVSASGELRTYFNGTNWMVSENGGAYHIVGAVLPVSVFTSTNTFQTQVANTVFAGPVSGGAAVPTFRALVALDVPALPYVSTTATQTANTFLVGPASGGAVAPTWRIMNINDVPDGLITFAKWSAQCAANEIPKRNAGNTAWICSADNTTPGGTAWVTTGNTSVTGGIIGTTDAQAFSIRANNLVVADVATSGTPVWNYNGIWGTTAAAVASAGTTLVNSVQSQWRGQYWNGSASTAATMSISNIMDATTPAYHLSIKNNGGTEVGQLDNGGNFVVTGIVSASNYVGGNAYFYENERSSPGLSTTGNGRIYMDSTSHRWMVSENGSAMSNLTGQGPTLWCQWAVGQAELPSTGYAYFGNRLNRQNLTFDDSATTVADFICTLPSTYDATAFTVEMRIAGANTTGNVVMAYAIERETTTISMNAAIGSNSGNGSVTTPATQTIASTAWQLRTATGSYTYSNAGSPVANDLIRVRISRLGSDAGDTFTGAVECYGVSIRK